MRVKTGLIHIDSDRKECDFCDKQKECASIDWFDGVIVVCKDCLQEFVNAFDIIEEE